MLIVGKSLATAAGLELDVPGQKLIARIADHPAKRIDELLPWNVTL
jgi:hypothetical protein